MLFRRVFSSSLNPGKCWYALTNKICEGPCKQFTNASLQRQFPEEIVRIPLEGLIDENGAKCHPKYFDSGRTKEQVFVDTAFGILGGLLRQREFKGFAVTSDFQSLVDHVNSCDLGCLASETDNAYQQTKHTNNLEAQLVKLKEEINFLEEKIEVATAALKRKNKADHVTTKPLSAPNSSNLPPTPESEESDLDLQKSDLSPNLNEIHNNEKLRPIQKRRNVESRTKSLYQEVKDICEGHRESIGSIIGHRILADDESVRSTLDEVVDVVAEKKGMKEGLEIVFSAEKWTNYFKTLRQPDWALLYFKLAARMPDEAWQTLLNITQLGRSGGCYDNLKDLIMSNLKTVAGVAVAILVIQLLGMVFAICLIRRIGKGTEA